MDRYVLSPAAVADLEQIWDYTCDRWGDDQAEEYLREVQRAIERIVDNPMIGRACDDVRPGYRKHAVGSHTLYYRLASSDVIDVVRKRTACLTDSTRGWMSTGTLTESAYGRGTVGPIAEITAALG